MIDELALLYETIFTHSQKLFSNTKVRQLNSNYDHISSIATLIGCQKEVYTAGCGMLIFVSTTLAHTYTREKNGVSYFRFIFPRIDNVSERFYINAFLFFFFFFVILCPMNLMMRL